jgi:hypothetical protein
VDMRGDFRRRVVTRIVSPSTIPHFLISFMLLFNVKISTQGTMRFCNGAAVDVLGSFCGSLCGIRSSYWISKMFCIESLMYTASKKKALMYQNIYCFVWRFLFSPH